MPSAPIRAVARSCWRTSPWRCTTVRPPMPAPATRMVRETATERSGDLVLQHAFRRPGLAGAEVGRESVQGRAIGADDLVVVPEVEEHMRMVERRVGADAHELLRTD